ncbi:hypothetical protein Vadar_006673 [Vaccinium darrowii]|uniref:Uncharacterized protein n=1 Tax=Vaccinium darrowii TaxID=229202 RepID=A0ACB7XNP6_9ERIC|nr:hypothetical protein Vadar_006673 [Vaccinium darrowii]
MTTFYKSVEYFLSKVEGARQRIDNNHTLSNFAMAKFDHWMNKARRHRVMEFNRELGVCEVETPMHPTSPGKGNHKHTVELVEAKVHLREVSAVEDAVLARDCMAKCVNQCPELIRQRTCNATISALEVISEVLPISSYSEKLLEMKGEALLMLGRYEEVIQLCDQTLVFAEKNVATTADDNYSEATTNPPATTTTIGENLLGDAIIQPRRVG